MVLSGSSSPHRGPGRPTKTFADRTGRMEFINVSGLKALLLERLGPDALISLSKITNQHWPLAGLMPSRVPARSMSEA